MRKPLNDLVKSLPDGAAVLDVGCLGFRVVGVAESLGRADLTHSGADFVREPVGVPEDFEYRLADLNAEPLPFNDDAFDLVVASHVIEHVKDPIGLIADCVRVLRPGGRLYVEAPSERSMLMPGFPFHHEQFRSLSFFDDPTHQARPWTPQSFYRLISYLGCECEAARHAISWPMRLASPIVIPLAWLFRRDALLEGAVWLTIGWASYAIARKPLELSGAPSFDYFYPETR